MPGCPQAEGRRNFDTSPLKKKQIPACRQAGLMSIRPPRRAGSRRGFRDDNVTARRMTGEGVAVRCIRARDADFVYALRLRQHGVERWCGDGEVS
jgi:hypothetical protein